MDGAGDERTYSVQAGECRRKRLVRRVCWTPYTDRFLRRQARRSLSRPRCRDLDASHGYDCSTACRRLATTPPSASVCTQPSTLLHSQYPVARAQLQPTPMSRHVHAQPAPLCAQPAHGPARLYVSQPLLGDERPPTCSTGSLAGSEPDMAIISVANTFSVTLHS